MTCDSRTPNQSPSGDIINNIKCDLADNNIAAISAADIRENMEDIVYSINRIVASGDTQTEFPFFNAVAATTVGGGSGMFVPYSGISFPNSPVESERTKLQTRPWLGPGGINHDELSDRNTSNDAHTQYLPIDGTRQMSDNLPMGANWINSSGAVNGDSDDNGLQFKYNSPTVGDDVIVGTSGHLKFNKDQSSTDSFHGLAKCWLRFDATTNPPTIEGYHNIVKIHKEDTGKFHITFTSGTFADNNYVAVGNSNANSDNDPADFDINSVGIVARSGDDGNTLRGCSFYTKKDTNTYVDAKVNDFVAYGLEPGSESGIPTPTSTTDV
tara:strand:+ start:1446 stop:2423 length:978 start_codon:yes stop_codon:yes gene_type:complete